MKNILFSGLFAILSLVAIGSGIANDMHGNHEVAVRCYVAAFAAVVIPGVAGAKFQRMQELCFLNKSFFNRNEDPWTRSEIALLQHLANNGKGQTKEDAANGKIKIRTYTRSFIFEITDAFTGTVDLLTANSEFLEGAIPEEWHGGRLPEGYNVAISHVGIGFVADGAVATPRAAIALATLPNAWPAALRNGRIRFYQAGVVKQEIEPKFCGPQAASFGRAVEDDGLELQAPMVLEESKATRIELVTAAGQAFASPAGGNYLEIKLFGAACSLRA